MTWVISFLVVLFVILWGYASSNLILKLPRIPIDSNPKSFGYDYESFKTITEDGVEIDGWFVPSKKKKNSLIFVLHGWGANRSDILPSTIFLAHEHNLVYFDFRNHGRSGGNKTSLTCLEIKDFEAVTHFIENKKQEFSHSMGVYGFSMGAAVAISGAAKMPEIKAVVAESSFSSFNQTIARFAKLFYGIPHFTIPFTLWFARIRLGFDPEVCAPIYHVSMLYPRPIFIIQGGADQRMPVSEGQSLYDSARKPKELWIIPEAGHGGVQEVAPEEYKKRVSDFYEKWLKN